MNPGLDSGLLDDQKLERPLQPGEVCVFQAENYAGQPQVLGSDNPDLLKYFPGMVINTPFASLRLGPYTGVTLYAEKDYQGTSQDLTTELASLAGSRFQDLPIQSLKIWSIIGKPFTGSWAIEVEAGRYLSASHGGLLTTSLEVRETETFHITKIDPKQGSVAFTPSALLSAMPPVSASPGLTLDDLQNVILHNEPGAGFRSFSLLTADNRWIGYDPAQDHFQAVDQKDRQIFHPAIKIAENESQIGGLSLGEVALFEQRAYWGKAWVFCTDCADFSKIAGLNEKISSIQLGPQSGVTIYSEPQYNIGTQNPKASKQDVTSNLPSLEYEQVGEAQISSLGLWKIVSPEGTGISFTCSLSQDFRGSKVTFREYSAYRTTLRLPLKTRNVDLWTTDETDIEVNGGLHHVSEDQPVSLPVISTKSLVITTDAAVPPRGGSTKGTLSAVGLKVRTDLMLPHERIVIYPDQPVHERLAKLDEDGEDDKNKDTLWNATYVTYDKNGKRVDNPVVKDRSDKHRGDVANAQGMITKVMSTVNYSSGASGGLLRIISAEALQGKAWVLDFLAYRVTAEALYVREEPDPKSRRVGFLRKNDVVEVLGFNVGAGWARLRRPADGLTGWSASKYLGQIPEMPSQGEQYQVKTRAIHVRKGPGVEFASLGYLQQAEIVTAIGVNEAGTWRKIIRRDGLTGWSSARYLSLVQPAPLESPSRFMLASRQTRSLDQGTVPPRTELPTLEGLTPQFSFREISQADMQAMLARAESPARSLMRGLWDPLGVISWIEDRYSDTRDALSNLKDAIANGLSIAWTALVDGVAVLIDLGTSVIKFIVDTAEKAIAVVEAIIEKIGAAIEEIIKWLRFLFEWEDILDTRDYLRRSILNALDYASQELPKKAEGLVSEFFEDKQDLITGWFDEAIEKLGGSSTGASSASSSSRKDTPEALDWIISKVTSGLSALSGGPMLINFSSDSAAEARLKSLWDDTLAGVADQFFEILEDLQNILLSLVENLDDPKRILADLLELIKDLLVGLLEMGETILLDLFELAGYLCARVKELLSTDLYIPLLSELLDWIGSLLGVDLSCSVIDIITLVLAVPVTIISKAALGRAPFRKAPAQIRGLVEADVEQSIKELGIAAGVASCTEALLSVLLDIKPELDKKGSSTPQAWWETILEILSFMAAVTGTSMSWNIYTLELEQDARLDVDSEDKMSAASKTLSGVLLGYDAVVLLVDVVCIVSGIWRSPGKIERFKRGYDWSACVASGAGILHLGLLIAKVFVDKENDIEDFLPDWLMTLPEIGSALRLLKNPVEVAWGFGLLDAAAAGAAIASIAVTAAKD